MSNPPADKSTDTGDELPRHVVPEADRAAAPASGMQAATAKGTEAGNPPAAEPYLRLVRAGASVWNQWQRTGMDAATAKRFKLDAIEPFSAEEAGALARRLGLDVLPSYDQPADLSRVDFTDTKNLDISFEGFVFGSRNKGGTFFEVRFNDATFGNGMRFNRATFGDGTRFNRATFGNGTRFSGAIFGYGTRFDGATFGDETYFNRAIFSFGTHFRGATFGNETNFIGATFGDLARFDGATFGDETYFNRATFNYGTRFDGATFGHEACFDGATFDHETRFDGITEDKLRDLLEQVVQGDDAIVAESWIKKRLKAARPGHFAIISFVGAVFRGYSSFRGREFEGNADFNRTIFRSVPDFVGCKELGHLNLSEVVVSFGGNRWWHLQNWTTKGDIDTRLRRLRKIAKDVEAGDLERDLFILERKAQRGRLFHGVFQGLADLWGAVWNRERLDHGRLLRNLRDLNLFRPLGLTLWLFLYGITSDYGRSIIRPLVWLMVSFVGFLGLYSWQYNAYYGRPLSFTDPDLISFTLGNALPFLSSLSPARRDVLLRLFSQNGPSDRIAIPSAIEVFSSVQSILGAVLLFLLLLAIRNRFRIS